MFAVAFSFDEISITFNEQIFLKGCKFYYVLHIF